MHFWGVPPLFAVAMAVASAAVLWCLVRVRRARRILGEVEVDGFRRATWCALPAVVLGGGSVVVLLATGPASHYPGSGANMLYGYWMFALIYATPFALVLMFAGYSAYPGGYPAKHIQSSARSAMFGLRVTTFVACVLSWIAMVYGATAQTA